MMRHLGMLAAAVMTATLAISAAAATCSDVPQKHWAAEAVDKFAGVMGACRFNGDKLLDRYMGAQLVAGILEVQGIVVQRKNEFRDSIDSAFSAAVGKAAGAGVMAGLTKDGRPGGEEFQGEQHLDRYHMALIIKNLLDLKKVPEGGGPPAVFKDVEPAHWAHAAVQRAVDAKILQGYEGKFNGEKFINRYQAVIIVGKILEAMGSSK